MTEAALTIEARDVCKRFGNGRRQTSVLRGVSLHVQRGETLFLAGPSGSGKTTLLSILGCILTPDSGSVRVFGQETVGMSQQQLVRFRRERLGFIFQNFNLLPTLTAVDNIRLALTMRGVGLRPATARAHELLEQLGLTAQAHLFPSLLSTGECQRVAIARALAARPEVLFADEPTASLDARNGQTVIQMLTQLARARGMTLIVVTHDSRVFPYADRILDLEDGRLIREWSPPSDPAEWEAATGPYSDPSVLEVNLVG
jgi:putative ABC transport system ATP-binding protein